MMLRVKSTMLTKRKSSTLKVTSTATQISEESNTNWSGCLTSWISVTQNGHRVQNRVLYFMFRKYHHEQTYTDPCTYAMQSDMRQLKEMIASDLANYMCEMMPSLNDCVDWVCDRFAWMQPMN